MTPFETSCSHTLPLGSDTALRRRFMVVDEPIRGNFRFGLLLEELDLLAEQTALAYVRRTHPEGRVVTAAIDNIVVRHVADVNRDVVCHARINHVGRSSLEIGIRVEQPGETTNHIASCYFTMVARGGPEAGESLPLPPLEYVTGQEKERAAKAMAGREEYRRQQESLLKPPSVEEYALLDGLHRAQEEPSFNGHRAAALVTDAWERMYPEQEYVPRRIFGGYLMRRAFELSAICSELVAPDRSVIAAVNRINFFHPVRLGDKLHFTSRVVYTDESFVCVETGIERISRDRTSKALSNSCLFTFVNVDRDLNHCRVPAVYPATYREDARYLDALRSYRALAGHYRML
ncbi:acyl-coenzyme A thioesterase 9, mitochondrial [Geobacter sp. OR-1]|uniref:hotdog domain-containing protein n=1 Tax=Geobacter sp. OR-1 TaxID=1266765 RepID=UPI00054218D8|nr:hotdog domain-containing protein [Geobacter sp. OR-1]GAM10303.1 acyl-coenzyme A thioesterase 9, mitochondrial [Geobacter sp. OR-1]